MELPAHSNEASPTRPHILICDDEEDITHLLVAQLKGEFDCAAVSSGEAALAHVAARTPDVVLSDLMMPGMSGLELCQRLRAISAMSSVPIVMITAAHADDELRATVFEAGADDYLSKPIGARELLARVRTLVQVRRARQELENRTAELEAANATLRAAQGTLVQTEKLATLGTLVAGIAHELNNPLAYMKSGSAQLAEFAGEAEANLDELAATVRPDRQPVVVATREILEEIRSVGREISDGAQRLARIAADLKSFSSTTPTGAEPIELGTEVRRAWSMAVLQAVHKPKLVIEESVWPTVVAQRHHIGQVLLNLFVNAVHALEAKGEAGEVRVWMTEEPDEVSLHAQDNGPGIPEEYLARIFDPFFTTKPPGKGTGLGLSVSFGLIRGMGGLIEAVSPPGEGAHFVIHLPREQQVDSYNATRLGRPPSRSVLNFVPRPPSARTKLS